MATFPVTTGDVLTAATYNSLPTFTVGSAQTADYTAVLADQYHALNIINRRFWWIVKYKDVSTFR